MTSEHVTNFAGDCIPACPACIKENQPKQANAGRPSKDVVQGPLWIPTPQVERMMRECRESKFDTIGVDRKSLEGLLHDSLLWRQERAARQIKPVETTAFRGLKSISYRPDLPLVDLVMTFDSMEAAQAARERVTALVMPPVEPTCSTCGRTKDDPDAMICSNSFHLPEKASDE